MKCRCCASDVQNVFADLGTSPPSNAYLSLSELNAPETYYPLRVLVCQTCWLVQTEDFVKAEEMFAPDYAYFSSVSSSWVSHAKNYADMMIDRLNLGPHSNVIEVAANDGYLLQFFQKANIPCLGIEPTAATANSARAKGIEIVEQFLNLELGIELRAAGKAANLLIANNVLAHVPNSQSFLSGISQLIKPQGIATFEFPSLLTLIQNNLFDTIYHEHFSYLSLTSVHRMLKTAGLEVFQVENLETHGGSLRVFAQHVETGLHEIQDCVGTTLELESFHDLRKLSGYAGMQSRIDKTKVDLLQYLLDAKRKGLKVAAYGAAAKGNTILNYAGIRRDLISFVVDRNPQKIGKFLPGSRIPIVSEDVLRAEKPDLIIILPWNLKAEVSAQLQYATAWGARFVTFLPNFSESEVCATN